MPCIPASQVNVIDSTTLTFVLPPHDPGAVCISVTVGGVHQDPVPGGPDPGPGPHSTGDAAARGWGSGWPDCHPELLASLSGVGAGLNLQARAEVVPLAEYLINETESRGYHLVPGWCWGYACRQIRATGIPSNHSWGLAFDLNAPVNPATTDGIIHTDMPSWVVPLWNSYQWKCGSQYTGSFHDPMHMEFMGTPADAASLIASLP